MSDLEKVRLNIHDPYGVLKFSTVIELPEPLVPQTAYIIDGQYYVNGIQTNLKISDDQILEWLAVEGATVDSVTLLALKKLRTSLKYELSIIKTSSGADSEDYQDVLSMWKIYDSEIKELEKDIAKSTAVKSSRYQQFPTPSWVEDV